MSRTGSLSKILLTLYDQNSRYDIGPPIKISKELEQNTLVVADMEISDEDIPVLSRFLHNKQAINSIEKIEIIKSSGGKVNRRRTSSALCSSGHRLFKDIFIFIEKCRNLQSVSFESVDIPVEILPLLGRALVAAKSDIAWLGFHSCDIGGDAGMCVLTPYLGRLHAQVLGIEFCGLTDQSIPFVTSILKAQENQLDSLYWNSTLRVDPCDDHGRQQLQQETNHVYSRGLVALSLSGNKLTGHGMLVLSRVLRRNYWLLGLNLANNTLDSASLDILVRSLQSNSVLQALLLKDNPGVPGAEWHDLLNAIIARNTNTARRGQAILPLNANGSDGVDSSNGNRCNGPERLGLLPEHVGWLLRFWIRLQSIERAREDGTLQAADISMLTQSTAATGAKKRYQEDKDAETMSRRQKETGLDGAYSVFHFLDRAPEPHVSYRQQGSPSSTPTPTPTASRSFKNVFDATSDQQAQESQGGAPRSPLQRSASFTLRYSSFRETPQAAAPSLTASQRSHNGRYRAEVDSEQDCPEDPLSNAIPTVHSPSFARRGDSLSNSGNLNVEMLRGARSGVAAERQSWDNLQAWPPAAADNIQTTAVLNSDRPPSRMSIRPSTAHSIDLGAHRKASEGRPPTRGGNVRQSASTGRGNSGPTRTISPAKHRKRASVSVRPLSASYACREPAVDLDNSQLSRRGTVFGRPPHSQERSKSAGRQRPGAEPSTRYYRNITNTSPTPRQRRKHSRRASASAAVLHLSALDRHVRDLTQSMLAATHNLEEASRRLQSASESLNESMIAQHLQLQQSMDTSFHHQSQQQQQSFVLDHSTADWGQSSVRPASAPGRTRGAASGIASYLLGSTEKADRPTPLSSSKNGSARPASPQSEWAAPVMTGTASPIAAGPSRGAPLEDADLEQLVREKLYERLETLLLRAEGEQEEEVEH